MMMSEIAPAIPAKNPSNCEVKPEGSTFMQPNAVLICLSEQPAVGSKANDFAGYNIFEIQRKLNERYDRIDL